jgi:peptidoglycan hydrolase-like protein with peptidoglycan-binding domain
MPATIREGDRGDDVKLCQQLLTDHGYKTTADGIFGSGTNANVLQFQRDSGLGADGIVGPNTWAALESTDAPTKNPPAPLPSVLEHLKSLGHEIKWDGDYHLNLFGIRMKDVLSNSFDDIMGCAYTVNGLWKVEVWPATTDPGLYYRENPMNVAGTAILCPGQYTSWKIGLHRGSYEALIQTAGSVTVWRDANKDEILDHPPGSDVTGYFGINLHRSSTKTDTVEEAEAAKVNKWSAGCQVHARVDAFNEMMTLAHKQQDELGIGEFTYTLMDQWW